MKWTGRLGVPYQGSKNAIAQEIVSCLPGGSRFVDLFAGGCAMTHAAILSGKYETFLANDLNGMGVRLFRDAIAGKCNGRWKEWVSREEFHEKKDTDPLIALCWSFGNNQSTYIYGKGCEQRKRNLHDRIVCLGDGFSSRNVKQIEALARLQAQESLQELERLPSLESIQALERMQVLKGNYRDVPFSQGDVVYADPPYSKTTEEYRFMKRAGMTFDSASFWEWCATRSFPVFVSEYSAPKGFTPIWSKGKCCLAHGRGANGKVREFLFVQDRYADQFQTDMFLGGEASR